MTNGPIEEVDRGKAVYETAYLRDDGAVGTCDWKILDGLPNTGLRILNVGGGDGADLWHAAEGNEIHLLDGSPSGVEGARKRGFVAHLADLEKPLDYPDGYFDVVVAKDILEHLISPAKLLAELHRVLKPDGRLVVSVPNHFYLTLRLRILFGGNLIWKTAFHDHTRYYREWDYMHFRFFTYRGFLEFLDLGGFKVERKFWDIGNLAHYTDPRAFHLHMTAKYERRPLTPKARFYFRVGHPAFSVFNIVLPRAVRAALVSLRPSLLCAGFYFHCRKASS